MGMMRPVSIKGQIQEIAGKGMPTVVVGNVESQAPIKIILKDDIGIQLTESSLLIPQRILPLEKGEDLFLLAVNDQKVYYVLDKVGKYGNGIDRDKAPGEYSQYLHCKSCPYC